MADSKVASEDEFRFAIGESMLCLYGPSLYEVKCILREKTLEGIPVYYIHYKGWKNTWNEWVCSERLLDVNEVNMKKMEMLKQKELESKKEKQLKKEKRLKKSRRSKTAKTTIEKLNKILSNEKQDQLSTKTRIDEIDNELLKICHANSKHNEQLKNLDISQMINGTTDAQLNLGNSSSTIVNKENACIELPIEKKKKYSEAPVSNSIPTVNNLSSESKKKKRGQPSKTLLAKSTKEKACNKLYTAQKKMFMCKEPASSNLIPRGNNSSSESEGEKRGQSSKTLPLKRKKACKSTPIAKRSLKSDNESKLDPKSVNVMNVTSFKPKVGNKGQTSKTLLSKSKKVCGSTRITKVRQCKYKSTRIAKVRQGKSNTPNSKRAKENKSHTLIEETHKRKMPTVNMWTQSISLGRNENVLTENIEPTFSEILIPKPEEPEIIDLTKDEEMDIKPDLDKLKKTAKSVVMNFFITTQNGEVTKHIMSLEHT